MKTLLKAGLVVLLSVLWACAPITPLFPQLPQSQSQGGQSGSSGGSSGGGSSGGGSSGGSSSGGGGSSGGGAGLPSPSGLPGLPGGPPGGQSGGPPGGQPGGQPGSEGGSPGAGEPLPTGPGGNVPGGEQGDGDGSDPLGGNDPLGGEGSEEGELAWEVLESGGAGEAGGEDGSPPGVPGAGEESWEQGESGSPPGGGGWEVSNEAVVPVERVGAPAMPAGSDGSASEDELDQALEEFDGEILAERAVLEQRSNENLGGRPGPGGPIASGSPATPDAGTISAPFPQSRQVPSPPMPQRTAGAQVPDDVPDARDDDIIARQLREAAMVENDPVLREKLWDEYRRYKGS